MKDFLSRHDLVYEKAPLEWVDGIPMANGDIGVLIWGDGNPLKITLDKYDTWEQQDQTPDDPNYNYQYLRKLIEEGREEEAKRVFETDLRKPRVPYPTRLPLPRLVIDFGESPTEFTSRLALHDAVAKGRIGFADGCVEWVSFVHSEKNLVVLEIVTKGRLQSPDVRISTDHWDQDVSGKWGQDCGSGTTRKTLRDWGYPEPDIGEDTFYQQIPSSGGYAIALLRVSGSGRELIFLSIASTNDADDPVEQAKKIVDDAAGSEISSLIEEHVGFWHEYWQKSSLAIPDAVMENLFYVEMYKLGCSSREGKYPCSLQGLWTQGDGGLPPWSGDYHLDMNVQETYWPVYTSNHLEAGMPLYEYSWKNLPRFRQMCSDFFGFEGAFSRCEMGLNGEPIYGYYTANFWPGNGAWLAHHFWLHWLYSRDAGFLRDRAYPFMRAFMQTYVNLLEKSEGGKFHLPLSNSPEYGENGFEAWGRDTSGDLALIRWLAESLLETVATLGVEDDHARTWQYLLENLTDCPHGEDGLHLFDGQPLEHSHRHFTHLLAVHPLGTLTIEGSDEDRELIHRSIRHIARMGTGEWTGHSFPEMSLIAARAGNGNMAWHMLKTFLYFIRPNTLHINRDQRGFGVSHYETPPVPMTLEAGFCFAAALMEMLLQSWGGTIRLFPAIPELWHDARFNGLRAEGAFLISAEMRNGKVICVEIKSEVGCSCRIVNPFGAAARMVNVTSGKVERLSGDILVFGTSIGGVYRLTSADSGIVEHPASQPDWDHPTESARNMFGLKHLPAF